MKYYNTFSQNKVQFLSKRNIRPIDIYDTGLPNQKGYVYVEDINLHEKLNEYKKERSFV